MVKIWSGVVIHGAGAVSLLGYGLLAQHAGDAEARPWMLLATLVGWLALGLVAWRGRDSMGSRWCVMAWAVAFRLVGIGTEPSWEDDYYRYLWDGYQTLSTGDPYNTAPADAFGDETGLPESVVDALDQVNFPDVPTVYGPIAQVMFAGAAWLGAGQLWILKLGFVVLELWGWLLLTRRLSWRLGVLLWWCPLAVIEIAFAGHVDAVGIAAVALAMSAWMRKQPAGVTTGVALAIGTKVFGVVLLPFVVSRFGWKWGLATLLGVAAVYAPFWAQGSLLGGEGLRTMSANFEYNSTGYAMLSWVLPVAAARLAAAGLFLLSAFVIWRSWHQRDRGQYPPVALVLGVMFWWSPVFNPWYALWLLPVWAVRPSAWGVGVLIAVSSVYLHGWSDAGGAVANYAHPWWVRPLEISVVIAAVLVGRWWRRKSSLLR